jgi:hypothetical protein
MGGCARAPIRLTAVWDTGVVPMLEGAPPPMRLESARIHYPEIITISDIYPSKRP